MIDKCKELCEYYLRLYDEYSKMEYLSRYSSKLDDTVQARKDALLGKIETIKASLEDCS